MADPCATYTFGGVTINGAANTDTLITPSYDNIQGLDGAPVRRQIDPVAQNDGDLNLQGEFLAGRVITFSGIIHIGTMPQGEGAITLDAATMAEFLDRVVTLQKAVVAACEAQLSSATNLAWTDSTGAARSISCFYGLPGQFIQFGGSSPAEPTFQNLTLWAPSPTITG